MSLAILNFATANEISNAHIDFKPHKSARNEAAVRTQPQNVVVRWKRLEEISIQKYTAIYVHQHHISADDYDHLVRHLHTGGVAASSPAR
jgi:hypothetical protein